MLTKQASDGTLTLYALECVDQRMAEEESGAWGCVDNGDNIVRLTGQQTNHAASKLFTLWVVAC